MMFQQAYLMCWKSAYSFFGKVKLSLLLPNKYLLSQIYVFLWFWFVGVAIMSALAIVYRMVVILVPSLRLCGIASMCDNHGGMSDNDVKI